LDLEWKPIFPHIIMEKIFLILLAVLSLSYCSASNLASTDKKQMRVKFGLISIVLPEKVPFYRETNYGIALATNPTSANDGPNDWRVAIYDPADVKCTPFALGVSELQEREVEGTKVWTGLVDAFDSWGYAAYEIDWAAPPPCQPPVQTYEPLLGGDWDKRIDGTTAYALCSEKDGKRVVICIQQMTDNPALAEEIFSTFKWTE